MAACSRKKRGRAEAAKPADREWSSQVPTLKHSSPPTVKGLSLPYSIDPGKRQTTCF